MAVDRAGREPVAALRAHVLHAAIALRAAMAAAGAAGARPGLVDIAGVVGSEPARLEQSTVRGAGYDIVTWLT